MANDYRVPVVKVAAALYTSSGTRHEVTIFMPPGQRIEDLLEAAEPFFAVNEAGKFCLYARRAIACAELEDTRQDGPLTDEVSGLPLEERGLSVHLREGGHLSGFIRFVPYQSVSRPVDVLNQPSRSFALYDGKLVRHVVKDHVERVEEI